MKCPKCSQEEVYYHAIVSYLMLGGEVSWQDSDEEESWLQCKNCGSKFEYSNSENKFGERILLVIGKEIDSQA